MIDILIMKKDFIPKLLRRAKTVKQMKLQLSQRPALLLDLLPNKYFLRVSVSLSITFTLKRKILAKELRTIF